MQNDRVLIVTGADSKYFELVCELIHSIEACCPAPITIGFLDFGITTDQSTWLRAHDVMVKKPVTGLVLGRSTDDHTKMGYLSRPFLRENFPGHSIYVWLDADVWLQRWDGIHALCEGADRTGAAVVPQNESAYRFWPWLWGWQIKHFVQGYGPIAGLWLTSRPHINNGVFALRADAPHWERWRRRYQRAYDQTGIAAPHDQFSLNAAVYLDRLPTIFMPATCNWLVDLATPMWNVQSGMLCAPYHPYMPITALHLAGPDTKSQVFEIKATDGTTRHVALRYQPQAAKR
jgi:hypothetical protein